MNARAAILQQEITPAGSDYETDRRVNRLYLKKAARPLLGKLAGLRSELTATALEGINPSDAHRLLTQLEAIKENVRTAIQNGASEPSRKEQRYG